jgi:ribonuclease HIII
MLLSASGDAEHAVQSAIAEITGVLPLTAGKRGGGVASEGAVLKAPLIGTDESGKGDFFGPLVVAAVMVTPETAEGLAAAGVRDCKTMSDNSVLTRAEHIQRAVPHAIVALHPGEYNARYDETGNLNRLLADCHARAIENILEKVDCDHVLTDQFGDKRLVENALMERGREVVLEQRPRAESNIAVAAASVVARAVFLEVMREMSGEYGVTFPKGASAQVDTVARSFVRDFGREELGNVAKLHFRNAQKI